MENIKILNLFHNSKYDETPWTEKIRIPDPSYYLKNTQEHNGKFILDEDSCVGKIRFYNSKFWKLQLMLHYTWESSSAVNYGFSVMTRNNTFEDRILNILDKYKIKYRINCEPYTTQIKISTKKSNLEIIDELYSKFYNFITNNSDYELTMKACEKNFM